MDLRDEMRRQAMAHAVADAISGVTRLQVADTVYDARYWRDYRAGLAAWREVEQRPALPAGRQPQAPPGDQVPEGSAHSDPELARRGWTSEHGKYVGPGWSAWRSGRAARSDVPWAAALVEALRVTGERAPGPAFTDRYREERMRHLEREWLTDPPSGFRPQADGPEAG